MDWPVIDNHVATSSDSRPNLHGTDIGLDIDFSNVAADFLDWGFPELGSTNYMVVDNGLDPFLGQISQNHIHPYEDSASIPKPPTYTLRSLKMKTNIRGGAQVTANLMVRIVHSYPKMMLHHDSLPPFIHPQWATTASENHRLEPLANCVSLVRMVGSGMTGSRKLFWRNVKTECERLRGEVSGN